jgi:hypothetical protein
MTENKLAFIGAVIVAIPIFMLFVGALSEI